MWVSTRDGDRLEAGHRHQQVRSRWSLRCFGAPANEAIISASCFGVLIAEVQIENGSEGNKPLVYVVLMLLKSAHTYDLPVKGSCAFEFGCVQERARRDSGEKPGAYSCYGQVIAKMKETYVSFVKTNLWALLSDPVLHHSTLFCCVFICRYLSLQEVDSETVWFSRREAGGLGSSVPRWGFCIVKRNREPGWLFFHPRSVKLNFFSRRGQRPARLGYSGVLPRQCWVKVMVPSGEEGRKAVSMLRIAQAMWGYSPSGCWTKESIVLTFLFHSSVLWRSCCSSGTLTFPWSCWPLPEINLGESLDLLRLLAVCYWCLCCFFVSYFLFAVLRHATSNVHFVEGEHNFGLLIALGTREPGTWALWDLLVQCWLFLCTCRCQFLGRELRWSSSRRE